MIYIIYVTLSRFVFILAISWFGRIYIAMENGRNLTEKFWEEIIMNRKLKTDFRFLLTKATQNCIFMCAFLCVCNSCCVLVYVLTYVYECFIGTEFSYNEN